MEELVDCFALDTCRGVCKILREGHYSLAAAKRIKFCSPDGCKFKQTINEVWDGRQRTWDRIQSLDSEQQVYIIDKYYGGKTPKELLVLL